MWSSNQGVDSNIMSIGNPGSSDMTIGVTRILLTWEMTIYFLRHHHYKSGLSPSTSNQFINIFDGQYNKGSLTSVAISRGPYALSVHEWISINGQPQFAQLYIYIVINKTGGISPPLIFDQIGPKCQWYYGGTASLNSFSQIGESFRISNTRVSSLILEVNSYQPEGKQILLLQIGGISLRFRCHGTNSRYQLYNGGVGSSKDPLTYW